MIVVVLGSELLQCIEFRFPEMPLVAEPLVGVAQAAAFERAVMNASIDFPPDEFGSFQHLEMLGNGVQRHIEWRGQISHPLGTVG